MRQRIVRMALVAGAAVLGLLILLTALGGDPDEDGARGGGGRSGEGSSPATAGGTNTGPGTGAGPATRLTVPSAYDTGRGWEIAGVSPEYAIAHATGLLAYLERVGDDRYRVRAVRTATGEPAWSGPPWRPLGSPDDFPHLVSLTKDDQQFFVTWSYGRTGEDPLSTADSFVSLDVYAAADGTRRRVEVPWAEAPIVTGGGPGVVISDGRTRSAVVAPDTGDVTTVPPARLGHPKGCAECRRLTEVRGMTAKGLLVSGARGFWVRGSWFSRDRAPAGADPASGVPASVTSGHVLARWQQRKGAPRAATHDIWAVHDARTGKPLVRAECHKPAIEPGEYPRASVSPGGRYLIAGNLAFDLDERTGRCFEEADGTKPLTLATVTDRGVAYGATSARSVADALNGGGNPIAVNLSTGVPEALAGSVRLPAAEVAGVGVFRWTDARDLPHLTGYRTRG
ncbi:hypothetical protein [Streptomyces sp. SP18CS02]|uniref:hypothetical protein n=1 Tax=Streptomyces sp. SP18CS02 TaxID=3002531 RepID=UPI002E76E8AF|nr:hypothetical protein [Streptomyces sp. SP18CS02]MEE1753242.1 hypothetical protein [Streptomyces sp. SP18CS02]